MKNRSIALFGEWNTSNLGDRAICQAAVHYILDFHYDVKLFSLGSFKYLGEIKSIDQLERYLKVEQSTLDDRPWIIRFVKKVYLLKIILRFLRNWKNEHAVEKHLKDCQWTIVGGGALLEGNGLHFPISLVQVSNTSRKLNIPILCLGCSSSSKFSILGKILLKKFISRLHILSVRDLQTRLNLLKLCPNVEISEFGDFAFRAKENITRDTSTKINHIGLNVMYLINHSKEDQEKYEDFVIKLLVLLIDFPEVKVTLFTTGDKGDANAACKIKKLMYQIDIFIPETLNDLIEFYKDKDLIIATRLHSGILALNHDVATIALFLSPKIKNFFKTIGLDEYAYSINQFENLLKIKSLIPKNPKEIIEQLDYSHFKVARKMISDILSH